jgi:hypothetical protein
MLLAHASSLREKHSQRLEKMEARFQNRENESVDNPDEFWNTNELRLKSDYGQILRDQSL